MSEKLKRYTVSMKGDRDWGQPPTLCGEPCPDGPYCLYSDVAALEAERDAAKKIIEAYELDYERVVVRGEKCAMELAVEEAESLRRYVGTEMLRSDFRTAAELRAAYEGALKSLDVAMREVACAREAWDGELLMWDNHRQINENPSLPLRWERAERATDTDPLCAATLERIKHEPPYP